MSRSNEEAFERLLTEHVAPLASRREPADVGECMKNEGVQQLFRTFDKALQAIFCHFATGDKRTHASQIGVGEGALGDGFGVGHSAARVPATRAINTMKEGLSQEGEFFSP